jgi:hypothetical protein
VRPPRPRSHRHCARSGLCLSGSTGAAARWCSRWWRAAKGYEDTTRTALPRNQRLAGRGREISGCEADQVETGGCQDGPFTGRDATSPPSQSQREQYSESERCSDQECVHFVPSHYLRAPPIGWPGHPYAIESATIAAGVVSPDGSPKLEPKKRTNYGIQFHPSSVGAPMTPISFPQAARGQPGRSPITVAITVARLSTGQSRAGRTVLSEQKVQVGSISPPQLFAGGFVDFLLGRGARHPR